MPMPHQGVFFRFIHGSRRSNNTIFDPPLTPSGCHDLFSQHVRSCWCVSPTTVAMPLPCVGLSLFVAAGFEGRLAPRPPEASPTSSSPLPRLAPCLFFFFQITAWLLPPAAALLLGRRTNIPWRDERCLFPHQTLWCAVDRWCRQAQRKMRLAIEDLIEELYLIVLMCLQRLILSSLAAVLVDMWRPSRLRSSA
jgi:hypothetical protein